MYNLILADLFKIRKSMAIKVLFGITTASSVAMVIMAYLIPQGKIDKSMNGIGFMFSDINMISILGAVIAGIYICGDFDNKTIHDAIASGCGRGEIIVSKALTFCFALVFILLPYVIVTGIALGSGARFGMGSVAVGFLNMLTLDAGKSFSVSELWKLLFVMATLLLVYAAQLSLCIPLAIVLKKPVLVVPIYYGASIFCAQLGKLKGSYHVFAYTPYGGNYAFVTLNTGIGDIIRAIVISLIFIFVILWITYFVFRKSEIK